GGVGRRHHHRPRDGATKPGHALVVRHADVSHVFLHGYDLQRRAPGNAGIVAQHGFDVGQRDQRRGGRIGLAHAGFSLSGGSIVVKLARHYSKKRAHLLISCLPQTLAAHARNGVCAGAPSARMPRIDLLRQSGIRHGPHAAAVAFNQPNRLHQDTMMYQTDNLRIASTQELIPAATLLEEFPLTESAAATVYDTRHTISNIIKGTDDRLQVVVGPCSIHNVEAALEYASLLKAARGRFADELVLVMRVYFEKPRTTIGWKGLINDPDLDHSFKINKGIRLARRLLLELAE